MGTDPSSKYGCYYCPVYFNLQWTMASYAHCNSAIWGDCRIHLPMIQEQQVGKTIACATCVRLRGKKSDTCLAAAYNVNG